MILLGKEKPEPILRSDLIGCRQGDGQTLRAEQRGVGANVLTPSLQVLSLVQGVSLELQHNDR